MNKAQQLVEWFKANGNRETGLWDIDVDFFIADDFVEKEIADQTRWSVYKVGVWKFDDDSYVEITWEEGSTEYQDVNADIYMEEVEPYEQTVIKYRAVK